MSLRYLPHAQLDLSAWDTCVAAATEPVPYAYSWWLAATAGRWDAVVEIDETSGAYLSVFPLPIKRRPWGREVYQPPFTQQLGLLTTAGSRQRNVLDYLTLIKGRFARFYLQLHTGQELASAPAGFQLKERYTYQLSLAPHYPALLAGFEADYRRRLRRNQEQPQPLAVTSAAAADELITLFQTEATGAAAGLKPQEYERLKKLLGALKTRGLGQVLEVRAPQSGALLAGAVFVTHPHRLIYLFAAASAAGRQAGAPLLLLNYIIQHHAGTRGLLLDFEGGMIPSIARFFANFGAAAVPYAALTQTRNPWYLSWLMR
ncbi:GNAT family N-acetyltransferase [Hymenobacter sp. DG25B]|uniref:GNAT family N-acetyltransferase n=1 Tax=Hymenobacter sp. DG25B TaxID=1385664 RepID=UPI0018CE5A9E|nr:GNAT family N-acetyltransferase [Hymenobacter sp. DG25B]